MDFSIFSKISAKKIWWVDVLFYFTISLLVSAVLCYLIFVLKIYLQKEEIKNLDTAIETVGTDAQKENEKTVIDFQKKINDYAGLISNHKFTSSVFTFLEKDILPNVWFYKFSANIKQNQVDLSGQADTLDALSRQTAAFEKNEFVKKVNLLGSNIGTGGKVDFNISLTLDPKIFNYVPPPPSENPITLESETESVIVNAQVETTQSNAAVFQPNKDQAAIITIAVLTALIAAGFGIFLFLKKRSKNKKQIAEIT